VHSVSALSRLTIIVALAACASTGTTAGPRHQSDLITPAEIASSGTTNAWDLINRLRPNWLRQPNVGSIGGGAHSQVIAVYINGHRFGDISSLQTVSASGIRSVQWLDAARAPTVLNDIGSDPIAGAILIKTQ
jgi:hypothetical protein